jgi:hypothetical protein
MSDQLPRGSLLSDDDNEISPNRTRLYDRSSNATASQRRPEYENFSGSAPYFLGNEFNFTSDPFATPFMNESYPMQQPQPQLTAPPGFSMQYPPPPGLAFAQTQINPYSMPINPGNNPSFGGPSQTFHGDSASSYPLLPPNHAYGQGGMHAYASSQQQSHPRNSEEDLLVRDFNRTFSAPVPSTLSPAPAHTQLKQISLNSLFRSADRAANMTQPSIHVRSVREIEPTMSRSDELLAIIKKSDITKAATKPLPQLVPVSEPDRDDLSDTPANEQRTKVKPKKQSGPLRSSIYLH